MCVCMCFQIEYVSSAHLEGGLGAAVVVGGRGTIGEEGVVVATRGPVQVQVAGVKYGFEVHRHTHTSWTSCRYAPGLRHRPAAVPDRAAVHGCEHLQTQSPAHLLFAGAVLGAVHRSQVNGGGKADPPQWQRRTLGETWPSEPIFSSVVYI